MRYFPPGRLPDLEVFEEHKRNQAERADQRTIDSTDLRPLDIITKILARNKLELEHTQDDMEIYERRGYVATLIDDLFDNEEFPVADIHYHGQGRWTVDLYERDAARQIIRFASEFGKLPGTHVTVNYRTSSSNVNPFRSDSSTVNT